jgi:hypothetical protein
MAAERQAAARFPELSAVEMARLSEVERQMIAA